MMAEARGDARSSGAAARCGRCGRTYDGAEWRALELVERIEGQRLEAFVTTWPNERSVEVRRCHACEAPIARTARR